jgi:hypothetical protein
MRHTRRDMTDMTPGQEILKIDARGRVRVPVERRELLLDEFENSGLSGKKFAVLVGIKHQTFATWVTKRRKQRGTLRVRGSRSRPLPEPAAKLQWVEAVVEKDAISSGSRREMLSVHLPGGARLEIGDSRQVALAAELLRALAGQRELPC